jgi:hypothetical protein
MEKYTYEVSTVGSDKANQPQLTSASGPAAFTAEKSAATAPTTVSSTAEKSKASKENKENKVQHTSVRHGLRVQFTLTKSKVTDKLTMLDVITRTTQFKYQFQTFFQPLVFKAELHFKDTNPLHIVRCFLAVLR